MPVTMKGAFTVEAERRVVWAKLHDPDFLRGCIRECEALRKLDETAYVGAARVTLGPFHVLFRGRIDLRDVDPPHGWRMVVRGAGGLAGRAKGIARVELQDLPHGTSVAYTIEANLGSRMMGLSHRLIDAAAQRVADRFFANVSAALLAAAERGSTEA
jgi:uncharacterized protein